MLMLPTTTPVRRTRPFRHSSILVRVHVHVRVLWLSALVVFCYNNPLAGTAAATTTAATSSPTCTRTVAAQKAVHYDQRSFIINGKRELLLCGSIHYSRIPRSDWDAVIGHAHDMGLNCIQTYVFWNAQQQQQEHHDETTADLVAFLTLLQQHHSSMYAIVRLGPFIGAETHFGGLPLWLRQSGATCFRCTDPVWQHHMATYVTTTFVEQIRPFLLTTSTSQGPIVALQIENEYNRYDAYMEWTVALARKQTTLVPWFLCHAVRACQRVQDDVLCSINGFWMDHQGGATQPGPEFFDALWQSHNTTTATQQQPAMWTEDQGWFDVWGRGHVVRVDPLYGMARFIAMGGSYHNLYMFAGGNNYGYSAGRWSTTAYAPDTAVDSFLLRHEPKYTNYQSFFRLLQEHKATLLAHPPALHGTTVAEGVLRHTYGNLVFLSNTNNHPSASDGVVVPLLQHATKPYLYHLAPRSVCILLLGDTAADSPRVLFNTSALVTPRSTLTTTTTPAEDTVPGHARKIELSPWQAFRETVGYGANKRHNDTSPEQLQLTENLSDYLYYSFRWPNVTWPMTIEPAGDGGICYVFVNGRYVQRIEFPEIASSSRPTSHATRMVARRMVDETLPHRKHHPSSHVDEVTILSVAMGLNNFHVGPDAGKGIRSVTVNGHTIITHFATAWTLRGEELEIYSDRGRRLVDWTPAGKTFTNTSLTWFQSTFPLPVQYHESLGGAQPEQTAIVANLTGLHKGILFVNGIHLGRYWLVPGQCVGPCAPPQQADGLCQLQWRHCGQPTQSLYHIPFHLLRKTDNLLTVLEESVTDIGQRNLSAVHVQILHDHPY